MKFLLLTIILISTAYSHELYLVTSHTPHDLNDLKKYTQIIKNNGRVIIVKKKKNQIPDHLKLILRKIDLSEAANIRPVRKQNLSPDKRLQKILSNINKVEIEAIVSKFSSYRTRSSGSKENNDVTKAIANEFKSFGLSVNIDCFKDRVCNVYGISKGSNSKKPQIIVEAHFDSVGYRYAGADDNASGIAGLLLIAREISKLPHSKSIMFFATNAEEKGLLGAKHLVRKLDAKNELKTVEFVLNMDMIGFNKKNNLIDIETNKEFESYARWMSDLVYLYTSLTPNITMPAWGSDHVPFLKMNVPSILTIEHWNTKTPCYHKLCDKPDHLTYDYAAEIVKLNIAAIYLKSVISK